MPSLVIKDGDSPIGVVPIDRDEAFIGKGEDCDLILPDQHVSKRHARISRGLDGFYIEDLQSTNGTSVDRTSLHAPRRLNDGSQIEICSYRLVFVEQRISIEDGTTVLAEINTLPVTDLTIARRGSEERLRVIMEIARELVGILDPDTILEKSLAALFRVFPQAERGYVLSPGKDDPRPIVRASRVRESDGRSPLIPSRTIYEHVTAGNRGSSARTSPATVDSGRASASMPRTYVR